MTHATNFNRKGSNMAVKVVIRRIVPEDRAQDLEPLLAALRTRATLQPGYISGETLRRLDKPDEYLVISTWESPEDWNKWATSQARHEVQDRIDTLLGGKTEYAVFHYGLSKRSYDS
jgi:heme-degrading monooxygenase HmoA